MAQEIFCDKLREAMGAILYSVLVRETDVSM